MYSPHVVIVVFMSSAFEDKDQNLWGGPGDLTGNLFDLSNVFPPLLLFLENHADFSLDDLDWEGIVFDCRICSCVLCNPPQNHLYSAIPHNEHNFNRSI